jgi:hypothetical protein
VDGYCGAGRTRCETLNGAGLPCLRATAQVESKVNNRGMKQSNSKTIAQSKAV